MDSTVINNTAYLAGKSEPITLESPYSSAVQRLQDALDRHETTLELVHARSQALRSSSATNGARLAPMDRRGNSPVVVYLHTVAERLENATESLGTLLDELEI